MCSLQRVSRDAFVLLCLFFFPFAKLLAELLGGGGIGVGNY